MTFLNPLFLWFSALISVPVIIYLINRQRYRRRRWAAMEFLLRALKKNQRRLQLESLLLLLIRVLILLLLVLAVARPVLRRNPLGMPTGTQQNWVLVLDTSYSMGYRDGPISLFDQARETLVQMVESLLKEGDKVALVTLAHEPRVLVPVSPVSAKVRQDVVREIRTVTLTALGVRLVPSLRLLEDVTGGFISPTDDREPCRIIFFSDLQKHDWLTEDGPRSPEMVELVERIRDRGGQFSVAQLAPEQRKLNVAVTELSIKPELVAREVPVEVRVTLKNMSEEPADNLDLTLRITSGSEVDPSAMNEGEAQLGEVLRIGGGDSVTRSVPYRFDSSGFYTIVAEVRSDGLVVDNRRFLVAPVQDDIEVLIVDGDPAVDASERETFYLEYALRPKDDDLGAFGGRFTPFLPEAITVDQLVDVDWKRYSLVILANVADIPRAAIAALERWVSEGGALLVFLGDQVDEAFYNEHLHREGEGLQPMAIVGQRGDPRAPVQLQFTDPRHPLAAYFEEQREASYLYGGSVSFFRYFQFGPPPPESGVRVAARFNDLDGSPALFDSAFGRGRVMWFASTADKEWNHLPLWHDYVIFLYESISYLMGFGSRSLNLDVGEPFVRFYDPSEFASEVVFRVPQQDGEDFESFRTFNRAMSDEGGRLRIAHEETSVPGLYRMDLKRPHTEKGDSVEYFAVNVDVSESDLRGMTATDFVEHFAIEPDAFDASERFREKAREQSLMRGREYWPWVLGAVLGLLLLETALAQLFGRRER